MFSCSERSRAIAARRADPHVVNYLGKSALHVFSFFLVF
jgi:hypothetical protein